MNSHVNVKHVFLNMELHKTNYLTVIESKGAVATHLYAKKTTIS